MTAPELEYDVALSFAGPDRAYVSEVAALLRGTYGLRVFFDTYEEATLWGKDLYQHLHSVYSTRARYTVIFISRHYSERLWTSHELRAAQERAFLERREYLLPARFDDTALPGLPTTIGYISLAELSPASFAALVYKKVGRPPRSTFVPDPPDHYFTLLGLTDDDARQAHLSLLHEFVNCASRLTPPDRRVLFKALSSACPVSDEGDVHFQLAVMAADAALPRRALLASFRRLRVAGFTARLYTPDEPCEPGTIGRPGENVSLTYLSADPRLPDNAAFLLSEAVRAISDVVCPHCAETLFERLDFSPLSTALHPEHSHSTV